MITKSEDDEPENTPVPEADKLDDPLNVNVWPFNASVPFVSVSIPFREVLPAIVTVPDTLTMMLFSMLPPSSAPVVAEDVAYMTL